MSEAESLSAGTCGFRAGTILFRTCGQSAAGLCGDCGIPVCSEHQHPYRWLMLCPRCLARRQSEPDSDSEASDSEIESFDDAAPLILAGSSGDDGEEGLVDEFGDSLFREEDYADFDAVSDYDREAERGGGYDS